MKSNSFGLLLVFILSLCLLTTSFAQNREQSISLDPSIGTELGGYFYQDPMSSVLQATYQPLESQAELSNYTLGFGDVISVSVDAISPITLRGLFVNPQGYIVAPIIGQLNVQGLTIEEASSVIRTRIDEILKDYKLDVSLDFPRQPTIFVTGTVPYSGKHTIDPFSRVDAAIFPAIQEKQTEDPLLQTYESVPSADILNQGSYNFRNIEIIRSTGDTVKADLYAFYKAGDLSSNPLVFDGDQIILNNVNRYTPKISISGAVMTSTELEYSENDTPALILEIAGGLQESANKNELFVYRNSEKLIVKLDEWSTFQLSPNDRIVVPRSVAFNQNAVAHIYGEVNLPGTFPIISGQTTAKELIEFAEGYSSNALLNAAYLLRSGSIENQVQNSFNLESLKRTSNQLEQGFSYLEMESRTSSNKVYLDLSNEESLDQIKLFNGDRIFVPIDEKTIFVFGQVNEPGYYNYSNTISVFDYIQRAGGFALSADRDRTFILKAGNNTWYKPEDTQLESGDKIFVDRIPFDELNAQRSYEIQRGQLKNQRIQLIMTGITTITGIITTYVAIQNISQ